MRLWRSVAEAMQEAFTRQRLNDLVGHHNAAIIERSGLSTSYLYIGTRPPLSEYDWYLEQLERSGIPLRYLVYDCTQPEHPAGEHYHAVMDTSPLLRDDAVMRHYDQQVIGSIKGMPVVADERVPPGEVQFKYTEPENLLGPLRSVEPIDGEALESVWMRTYDGPRFNVVDPPMHELAIGTAFYNNADCVLGTWNGTDWDIAPRPTTRWWVEGEGSENAHWSNSPGGPPGASIPEMLDTDE